MTSAELQTKILAQHNIIGHAKRTLQELLIEAFPQGKILKHETESGWIDLTVKEVKPDGFIICTHPRKSRIWKLGYYRFINQI